MNSLLVLQNVIIARKAGTFFKHTEKLFSSYIRQSMRRRIKNEIYSQMRMDLRDNIYFGSPFGLYTMFHTLMSVRRKRAFQYA